MNPESRKWFDEAAGPLVRPYARTGGRTAGSSRTLDMLTIVVVPARAPTLRRIELEYGQIVELCRRPHAVAEVSAAMRMPLAVTKILIGDLIADGILVFRAPVAADHAPAEDITLLRAVLDGIKRI